MHHHVEKRSRHHRLHERKNSRFRPVTIVVKQHVAELRPRDRRDRDERQRRHGKRTTALDWANEPPDGQPLRHTMQNHGYPKKPTRRMLGKCRTIHERVHRNPRKRESERVWVVGDIAVLGIVMVRVVFALEHHRPKEPDSRPHEHPKPTREQRVRQDMNEHNTANRHDDESVHEPKNRRSRAKTRHDHGPKREGEDAENEKNHASASQLRQGAEGAR